MCNQDREDTLESDIDHLTDLHTLITVLEQAFNAPFNAYPRTTNPGMLHRTPSPTP